MSEMVRRPRILSAASAALIIGQAMAKMSGAALAEFKSGLKIKPSRSKSKGLSRCKQIERGIIPAHLVHKLDSVKYSAVAKAA